MDIYQAIWDADMIGNGIRPISPNEKGNISQGFVVVDTVNCDTQHHIFKEVCIPDVKRKSYILFEKLLDNYALNQTCKEKNTASEAKEVEDFLLVALNSPPMKMAKNFF